MSEVVYGKVSAHRVGKPFVKLNHQLLWPNNLRLVIFDTGIGFR